jgi:hypothetical protein
MVSPETLKDQKEIKQKRRSVFRRIGLGKVGWIRLRNKSEKISPKIGNGKIQNAKRENRVTIASNDSKCKNGK